RFHEPLVYLLGRGNVRASDAGGVPVLRSRSAPARVAMDRGGAGKLTRAAARRDARRVDRNRGRYALPAVVLAPLVGDAGAGADRRGLSPLARRDSPAFHIDPAPQ